MLDIKTLEKVCPQQLKDVRECIYVNTLRDQPAEINALVDNVIEKMDYMEFFSTYLNWNGIIGYTHCITLALDGARAAMRI